MMSPLSAGPAGSNSMSGLSLRHVSDRFREMLDCVSILFPLVNKPRGHGGVDPARKPERQAEHGYFL
jgi:hypothetical protein